MSTKTATPADLAHEEATVVYSDPYYAGPTSVREVKIKRAAFETGAEYERDRAATQDPAPTQVRAAARVLFQRSHRTTGRQAPFDALDPEEQAAWDDDALAVLIAARDALTAGA